MKDYVLKILIPFQSPDDPAARERAGNALDEMSRHLGDKADIKLVEVYDNKPPRSVKLVKEAHE
jgi:hypothetical protein